MNRLAQKATTSRVNLLRVHAALLALSCCVGFQHPCHALPVGGSVVSGSATLSQSGSTLNIEQNSSRAMIDWRSFSSKSGERIIFKQPSANALAVNRVTGNEISSLAGLLSGNGHVVLVNPNGIVFQEGARVDLGSLVATTHWINKEDFDAGRYTFAARPGSQESAVSNHGVITTAAGGSAILSAAQVVNSGLIQAHVGQVALAAGDAMTLHFDNNHKLGYAVPASSSVGKQLQAINNGTLQANGGTVSMTADAKEEVMNSVVSMGGRIEAKAVDVRNGRVILHSGAGTSRISGTVDVSGEESGSQGGRVEVTGNRVELTATARLNGSGDAGGGILKIGGDRHGSNPAIANATTTLVESGATLNADAKQSGQGGEVVVWSNKKTEFRGAASARGGKKAGDGGFVEISGKQKLQFAGQVDASAAHGRQGMLLLDPNNVYIENVSSVTDPDDSSITPTSLNGVTANILLQADNSINFLDTVALNHSYTLTALAGGDINIQNTITVNADLNFTSTAGNILFSGNGAIAAGSNAVTLNAAQGKIAVQTTVNPHISAASLLLNSATGIGHSDNSQSLNTAVDSLTLTNSYSGDVRISNSQAMIVSGQQLAHGDISLTTSSGDLTINQLSALDSIQLTAAQGAIKVSSSANLPQITADTLTLSAKSGIGVDQPLYSSVNNLQLAPITGASGSIRLSNNQSVTLSGSHSGSDTIELLTTSGDITLNGLNASSATVRLNATDSIKGASLYGNSSAYHLSASSADLSAESGIGADTPLLTQLSSLSFHAGGNVAIGNTAASAGALTIQSSDYRNASSVQLTHTNGDLQITALAPSAGSGAAVTLTAESGQILNINSDSSAIMLAADHLTLNASSTIGSSTAPLRTAVNTLSFTSGGGNLHLNNDQSLLVSGTYTGSSTIDLRASGNLTVQSIVSSDQQNQGIVLLTATGDVLGSAASSTHIAAAQGNIVAVSGIGSEETPLQTALTTLSFSSQSGDVHFVNSGNLTVSSGSLDGNGTLDLQVQSGVTAGFTPGDLIISGTLKAENALSLEAAGTITTTGSGSITAVTASLTASSGIGTAATRLQSDVDQLDFHVANGSVHINNSTTANSRSLLILNGSNASGDIELVNKGNLTVQSLSTGSGVTLSLTASAGEINGDSNYLSHLSADNAILSADNGIGKDTPLLTSINSLEFAIAAGSTLQISNSGSMTVKGTYQDGNTLSLIARSGSITVDSIASSNATAPTSSSLRLEAADRILGLHDRTSAHVAIPTLLLFAANGIGESDRSILSNVDTLTFSNSGSGTVRLENQKSLFIEQGSFKGDSTVVLSTSTGDLTVQSLTASDASTEGRVSLTANNGRILGNGSGPHISAATLNLSANQGIGVDDGSGGVKSGLQTSINTLTLSDVGGDLYLSNDNSLTVSGTYQESSTIQLTADNGNLSISSLSSANDTHHGNLSLQATNGQILGVDNTTHIKADTLTLSASTGIGTTGTPLSTAVNQLTFTNQNSGDVLIQQENGFTVTGKQWEAGKINLTASTGDIMITELTANDTVTLTANEGTIKGQYGITTHLTAPTANLTVRSGNGDEMLDSKVNHLIFDSTSDNDAMRIRNADSWTVQGTLQSGSIELLTKNGDIHIASINGPLAGSSRVTLTAENGAIIGDSLANDTFHVTADTLSLKATNGIGAIEPLLTKVNQVEFNTGSGHLQLSNSIGLQLSGSYQNDSEITATVLTGDLHIDSITADNPNGTLRLTSTAGAILGSSTTTPHLQGSSLILTAAGDIGSSNQQLYTSVNTLHFQINNGSLYLTNQDRALAVTGVSTASSRLIEITNQSGDLTIHSIAPEANASIEQVKLTATTGSILAGNDNPLVIANQLNLVAGESIGGNGTLRSTVNLLTFDNSGSGKVTLSNSHGMTVDGKNVDGSTTTLIAETGNLLLDTISGTEMWLYAESGSIQMVNSSALLTADTVTMQALSGIGTSSDSPLKTSIDLLTATVNNGSIFLDNSKELTINTVTASNAVNLWIVGALQGNVSVTPHITAQSASITSQGIGTAQHVITNVEFLKFYNDNSKVNIINTGKLQLQGMQVSSDTVDIATVAGDLLIGEIESNGAITLSARRDSTQDNTQANIWFTKDGSITLPSKSSSYQVVSNSTQLPVALANRAYDNNNNNLVVTLNADGAISYLDPNNSSHTVITANSASLNASNGVGSRTTPLRLNINQLDISQSSGGVFFMNNETSMQLNRMDTNAILYMELTSGDLTLDGPITAGGMTFKVDQGAIIITEKGNITSTGSDSNGIIDFTAANGIKTAASIFTSGAPVLLNSPLSIDSGNASNPFHCVTARCADSKIIYTSGGTIETNNQGIFTIATQGGNPARGGDITFDTIVAADFGANRYLNVQLLAGIPVNGRYSAINGGAIRGDLQVWNAYLSASQGNLTGNIHKTPAVFKAPSYGKEAAETIFTFPAPHNGSILFNGFPVPGRGWPNNYPGPFDLLSRSSSDYIPKRTSSIDWVLDTSEHPVLYRAMQEREKHIKNNEKQQEREKHIKNNEEQQANNQQSGLDKQTDPNNQNRTLLPVPNNNLHFLAIGINYNEGNLIDRNRKRYVFWSDLGDLQNNAINMQQQFEKLGFCSINGSCPTNSGKSTNNTINSYFSQRGEILNAMKSFAKYYKEKENNTLVIYFTGHGLLFREKGFWISKDARVTDITDGKKIYSNIMENLIEKKDITNTFKDIKPSNKIIIITDACTPGDLIAQNEDEKEVNNIYVMSASLPYIPIIKTEDTQGSTLFSDKLITILKHRELNNLSSFPEVINNEIFFLIKEGLIGWEDWSKRSNRIYTHQPLLKPISKNLQTTQPLTTSDGEN
ncbi:MAG: filamentous hemagglutinin N-terminal domain-containing protein [Magnetococcales bacterium]|nr:filamentous hemagglutinin N-terminal domain-containing protein [Magnetococcales bacterium]